MIQLAGTGTLKFQENVLVGSKIAGWISRGCGNFAEHFRDNFASGNFIGWCAENSLLPQLPIMSSDYP